MEEIQRQLLKQGLCGVGTWVVLFYTCVVSQPYWLQTRSSKDFENNRYWIARQIVGTIHAVLIAVVSVPALLSLHNAPDHIQIRVAPDLAMCGFDTDDVEVSRSLGFVGMVFTTFIVADLTTSLLHGTASLDYVVHHVAFMVVGCVIRGHCLVPYNASILLAMETSTPFLNFVLLFRNRNVFKPAIKVCGVIFVVFYIIFRLVFNTYGSYLLWSRRSDAFPASVPVWQVWVLLGAVLLGTLVQFAWFPMIVKFFLKEARALAKKSA